MLIKPSLYDDLIVLPDVESPDEAPMSVEILSHDDPDEAPMLVEMGPLDRPVAPPPPPPVGPSSEAPMLAEIWIHEDPNDAPIFIEIRPLEGLVPSPPPPPPNEASMQEEIWLYDEPVPPPPVEHSDEVSLVLLLDEPVEAPNVEPPNEAQDFDAIVSAFASRNPGDVQLTFSWWRMHHGTEDSWNRLTDHLTEVVENEDIDILDYLLHQGVPFTLRQIEKAVQIESIFMPDRRAGLRLLH